MRCDLYAGVGALAEEPKLSLVFRWAAVENFQPQVIAVERLGDGLAVVADKVPGDDRFFYFAVAQHSAYPCFLDVRFTVGFIVDASHNGERQRSCLNATCLIYQDDRTAANDKEPA